MNEDVLLAVDGSEENDRAIEQAFETAELTDATLHVVHVVDRSTSVLEASPSTQRILEALEEKGQKVVDDVVERARRRDRTVEASVLAGVPHRTVLDYAKEHAVDLIVVGTHGRTGVERAVIGSVAERVVRNADVPVLVVPDAPEDED